MLRPSYASLVASLRHQTRHDYELIARNDPGNEYIARNRGAQQAVGDWLVFADDDSTLRPDHLDRIDRATLGTPDLVAVSGALEGNMFGQGPMRVSHRGWWIGANMAVRRDVFLERPFEEDWGLGHTPKGWRADSDLGFSIEDRYPGRWEHLEDLVVDHPGPMGSVWQPDVEDVFFKRWRSRYIERFAPVDPRGQQFLIETQELTPEERRDVLKCRKATRATMPDLPKLAGED